MGLKFLSQNFSHMMPLTCYYLSSGGLLVNFKSFMPKTDQFGSILPLHRKTAKIGCFWHKTFKIDQQTPRTRIITC